MSFNCINEERGYCKLRKSDCSPLAEGCIIDKKRFKLIRNEEKVEVDKKNDKK